MSKTIVVQDIGLNSLALHRAGPGFGVIIGYDMLDAAGVTVFSSSGVFYSSTATDSEGALLTPTLPPAIESGFITLFGQIVAGLRQLEGV